MGKATQMTEKPDPRQTRGETLPLASPLESCWHPLTIIPLHYFCFITLHLTVNNIKTFKAQHQATKRCSYHNILQSLKTRTLKWTWRPRAGPTSPRETLSEGHKAVGRRNSFSRLTQHHLWTKPLHLSGVFGKWQMLLPAALRGLVFPHCPERTGEQHRLWTEPGSRLCIVQKELLRRKR